MRPRNYTWTTSDGRRVKLHSMDDEHLANIIRWFPKQMRYGGKEKRKHWTAMAKRWLPRIVQEMEYRDSAASSASKTAKPSGRKSSKRRE